MLDDKKTQDWRTSGEPNQRILELEYKEKTFLSKEEVAKQWVVSKATFENWLAKIPAKTDEFKTERNGKKLFRSDYVENLVKKFGKKKTKNYEPVAHQNDNLWEKIIESKDDQIKSMTNQIEQITNQMTNQHLANEKLLRILNQSQILQLESLESKKKLENKSKNWWNSFLVFLGLNSKD